MKTKIIQIATVIFCQVLICKISQAQDVSSSHITWVSHGIYDITKGKRINEKTTLTTYAKDSLIWVDANGKIKLRFKVRSIKGNWPDASKDGDIQYSLVGKGHGGVVHIKRRKKIEIELTLIKPRGRHVYRLDIDLLQKI